MFSTLYGTFFPFWMHFKMLSAIYFNLGQSRILSSGNGLNGNIHLLIHIIYVDVFSVTDAAELE